MICQLPENYDDFIIGEDLNSKKKLIVETVAKIPMRVVNKWLDNNSMDVTSLCDSTPSYPNGFSYFEHFLIIKKVSF